MEGPSNVQIMVVEDEWVIADDIQKSLHNLGYSVSSVVPSGEDAIRNAGDDRPDLVLMDIVLQGEMDGIEAAKQIRQLFNIPVIFLTAFADKEMLKRAKLTEPFGYMIKPFDDRELHCSIEMGLFKHKTENNLRLAKEAAEKATELKDKFVSLVAHDLRSPFITILGFLKLILKDKDHPLHEKHRETIKLVVAQGEGLDELISELLDISRFKTGKIRPDSHFFDGHKVAIDTITKLQYQAEKKGIKLTCNVPTGTRLYADINLYNQVIQNLLTNAIKFCNEGGSITMFVPDGESATIAVKDTGIGIKEERHSEIFKYEERTSTTGTSGERGTGLGLPLCRDIMNAHDGMLELDSQPGEGSIFYAKLPLVHPVVLIVEDDPAIRLMLRRLLEKINSKTIEAENGKEALDILAGTRPDLVVSDISMPIMDGYDLLENIRKNLSLKNVPIIILTVDDQEATRERVFSLGANDFVNKPIASADFVPRVRRYIG